MSNLEFEQMPNVRGVISLTNGKLLAEHPLNEGKIAHELKNINRKFRRRYKNGFGPADIKYAETSADDIAVLNYTSGTTGWDITPLTLGICSNSRFSQIWSSTNSSTDSEWLRMWVASVGLKSCSIGTIVAP